MINKHCLTILLIITVGLVQISRASAPKVGTNGATELLIPMGAQNVALGGFEHCQYFRRGCYLLESGRPGAH
jgi:hypothetical protein